VCVCVSVYVLMFFCWLCVCSVCVVACVWLRYVCSVFVFCVWLIVGNCGVCVYVRLL